MDTLKKLSFSKMNYYLYLPRDFDENKKYPLLIFLHGSGERDKISKLKSFGPLKESLTGMDLPFVMLYPHCQGKQTWNSYLERLAKLIKKYKNLKYIDENKVYLTGLSMGGFGTWALAIENPDMFAAIAPLCGGGIPWTTYTIKDVPTWAFHGDKDDDVKIDESIRMVKRQNEYGGNAKLTILEGYNHGIWNDVYHKKELYEWFLDNSLKRR